MICVYAVCSRFRVCANVYECVETHVFCLSSELCNVCGSCMCVHRMASIHLVLTRSFGPLYDSIVLLRALWVPWKSAVAHVRAFRGGKRGRGGGGGCCCFSFLPPPPPPLSLSLEKRSRSQRLQYICGSSGRARSGQSVSEQRSLRERGREALNSVHLSPSRQLCKRVD